jgi:(E)-4-hydroxy-3-methylbut-2-enyl-diphosphate synthase
MTAADHDNPPQALYPRRPTRRVTLGDDRVGRVRLGGGLYGTKPARVTVQSMTSGYTHDVDACVAEVNRLAEAGADVVRVAVPGKHDTDALRHVLPQVSVPIVADVHFHFGRALEAVEAGVHKIRLNPGNISDREQVRSVIAACKERSLPIRIGVNEGSVVERRDKKKRQQQLAGTFGDHRHGHLLALFIAKLEEYLEIFDDADFHDIVISAKSPDPTLVTAAYSEIASRFEYPLHLGVTHAGPRETAIIRSVAPLSHLLCSGIGDTLRISYASDPVHEVEDALELLYCLELRERQGVDLIACPTCGRIQVDLFTLVQDVRESLAEHIDLPIKVAVMGCVVNGPGEAEGADVAIFAGNQRGIIYVQGEKVANVPEEQILDRLLEECRAFQDKVRRGDAKLGEKTVQIVPPDPIGELGSGADRIAAGQVAQVPLTVSGS